MSTTTVMKKKAQTSQLRPSEKFTFVSVQASFSSDLLAEKATRDLVRSHARRSRLRKVGVGVGVGDLGTNIGSNQHPPQNNDLEKQPPLPLSEQLSKFRLNRPIVVSHKKRVLKSKLLDAGVDAKKKKSSIAPVDIPVEEGLDSSSTGTNNHSTSIERVYRSPALPIFRDCGLPDPFDSLPIPLGTGQRELLSYYATNLTQSFVAFDPNKELITQSNSDPAWLNATFSLVALHHDLRAGKGLSRVCLYHRGEALRLINERLSTPSTLPIRESTLGAVASLVNFDITAGSTANAAMHMTGLQTMVNLHGGLSSFSHNRVLQNLITWSDLLFSSASDCPPTFKFTCPTSHISPTCIADVHVYESHTILSPGFNAKMHETIRILQYLSARKLNVMKSLHKPDLFNLVARTEFSNCMYLAEYRLLTLFDDIASQYESRVLRKPWRLTVYLYLHLALRDIPGVAPLEHNLSRKLRHSLEGGADLCGLWSENLGLLMWILFIGAVAAGGRMQDRRFFLREMLKVRDVLRVGDEGEFVRFLKSCLWLEAFCTVNATEVWGELERERGRIEGFGI